MSAVVICLLFLACGWKLYKDCIYTRYIAFKNSGHPQYFGGALCAVQIFLLSFFIDALAAKAPFFVDTFSALIGAVPLFADNGQQPSLLHFARIGMWSIPVTWLFAKALNFPFHRSPDMLIAAARKTRIVDELEDTIYYCLKENQSVCLTMKSKKVYIGVPKRHSPDPDRDRVWLAMWPLASGYRDDQGKLVLTTFYGELGRVHAKGPGTNSRTDFQIVMPISEISVAQAFDLFTYAKFQQLKTSSALTTPPIAASWQQLGTIGISGSNPASVSQAVDASLQHRQLSQIIEQILSKKDRYHLRIYSYYVIALSLSVFIAPYDPFKAFYLLLVALVACLDAIQPLQLVILDWLAGRWSTISDWISDRSP
ncbi:MAG TPA: hypothetical protein VK629_01080 [Steroidobacteraceae bacterium]|nr:hypothetical protein [Steroidobacteraceae bacterium]